MRWYLWGSEKTKIVIAWLSKNVHELYEALKFINETQSVDT